MSMAVVAHTHATPTCSVAIAAHKKRDHGTRDRCSDGEIVTIQKISAGTTNKAAAVVLIPQTVGDSRLKGSTAAKNRSGVPMMCIAQLRLSR
jgi:hypothetical protein